MTNKIRDLHFRAGVERHSAVPYLWRARCYCGEYFLAASEEAATMGLTQHIEANDPFPIDMTSDDPSHGRSED